MQPARQKNTCILQTAVNGLKAAAGFGRCIYLWASNMYVTASSTTDSPSFLLARHARDYRRLKSTCCRQACAHPS